MYEKLKAKGIDMSWYEKASGKKAQGPVSLFDDRCGRLSIYLLKADGTLWTVNNGEPYMQVRETGKKQSRVVYLCAHCKKQFNTSKQAYGHEIRGK